MTHTDEGRLQAYLDGELLLEERWRTEQHLQKCDRCQEELDQAAARADRFASAVRFLDTIPPLAHAAPTAGLPAIPLPSRTGRSSAAGGALRRLLPRAAVALLFVGAAASATVPGSPVREWIERMATPTQEVALEDPEPPVVAAPPAAAVPEAGVFVDAVGGTVLVVLQDARDVRVQMRLVEGPRAGVAATGAAASSHFTSAAGRVEVHNTLGGELSIEIPRGISTATIMINDDIVLRKQDSRLDLNTDLPRLDSAGIAISVEN